MKQMICIRAHTLAIQAHWIQYTTTKPNGSFDIHFWAWIWWIGANNTHQWHYMRTFYERVYTVYTESDIVMRPFSICAFIFALYLQVRVCVSVSIKMNTRRLNDLWNLVYWYGWQRGWELRFGSLVCMPLAVTMVINLCPFQLINSCCCQLAPRSPAHRIHMIKLLHSIACVSANLLIDW